jgi:hypothetical protein
MRVSSSRWKTTWSCGPSAAAFGCRLVIEFARRANAAIGLENGEAPGHAEMQDQAITPVSISQDVFGTARQAVDTGPFQPR